MNTCTYKYPDGHCCDRPVYKDWTTCPKHYTAGRHAKQGLTYRKGPLGYAVQLDGKPWGSIKDYRPHGWQVRVPTLNPVTATQNCKLFRGKTVFPTVKAAKAAIVKSLGGDND